MLERHEIDFNMGSQTFRYDRSLVTDHAPILLITKVAIFFKSRDAYELNTWEMIAVFEKNTWILFSCLVVATFGALLFTYIVMGSLKPFYENILQAIAFISRTLVLRKYDVAVNCISSKTICVAVGILGLVMFAYLRAGDPFSTNLYSCIQWTQYDLNC